MNTALAFERRRQARPDAPPPSLRVRIRLVSDRLGRVIFSNRRNTVLFVLLQLACAVLVLWSLWIRLPAISQSGQLQHQVESLRQQYHQLKTGWSDEQLDEIEHRLQSEQARVLDSFPALAAWLNSKTVLAAGLGLGMRYSIQPQQQTRLADTVSAPVSIALKVEDAAADNSYSSVLRFIHSLIDDNLHLTVRDSVIDGDGNGITEAKLTVEIWVHDADGMAVLARTSATTSDEGDGEELSDEVFIE